MFRVARDVDGKQVESCLTKLERPEASIGGSAQVGVRQLDALFMFRWREGVLFGRVVVFTGRRRGTRRKGEMRAAQVAGCRTAARHVPPRPILCDRGYRMLSTPFVNSRTFVILVLVIAALVSRASATCQLHRRAGLLCVRHVSVPSPWRSVRLPDVNHGGNGSIVRVSTNHPH
jgi:hypothetical protein